MTGSKTTCLPDAHTWPQNRSSGAGYFDDTLFGRSLSVTWVVRLALPR